MTANRFDIPLSVLAERAKKDMHTVARMAMMEVMGRIVQLSPVGNTDRWKRPVKGYVGGRFKNNWYASINVESTATSERIDASGSASLEQVKLAGTLPLGGVIYFTNSLPYAYRLEFEGWSKAAPAGMIRKAAGEFADAVEAAVARGKKGEEQ